VLLLTKILLVKNQEMTQNVFPQIRLWEYVKDHVQSKSVVLLIAEMKYWSTQIKQHFPKMKVIPITWSQAASINQLASQDILKRSLIIALVNDSKKCEKLNVLYDSKVKFVMISPTSTLGLSGCGTLFKTYNIDIEIIPETIYSQTSSGQFRKQPFNFSLFISSSLDGRNSLRIREKLL